MKPCSERRGTIRVEGAWPWASVGAGMACGNNEPAHRWSTHEEVPQTDDGAGRVARALVKIYVPLAILDWTDDALLSDAMQFGLAQRHWKRDRSAIRSQEG